MHPKHMCEIGDYVLIASMLRKEREREKGGGRGEKGEGEATKLNMSSAIT